MMALDPVAGSASLQVWLIYHHTVISIVSLNGSVVCVYVFIYHSLAKRNASFLSSGWSSSLLDARFEETMQNSRKFQWIPATDDFPEDATMLEIFAF